MRKIVVTNNLTLDGVMQAPGRPDEDLRGGFDRGGWALPYQDPVLGRKMGEGMAGTDALLLGRRTYTDFAGYWPQQTGNPFTPVLDKLDKYVVSTTLTAPLPWQNSILIGGDPVAEVTRLKQRPGGDIAVLGSGELVRTLHRHGLVDTWVLLVHPLLLGRGRRLFPDGTTPADLRLTDSVTSTTGVLIATYERG
ncbi:dihydrofolate reductase family protein [Micromonospora siamensis]|uniref:Dihydrofolate reductase n=1 Tax=Micromonospora siamensis TaxID=299152 RepID=A0A1C5ILT3_9ACTN|nr:dihydrofolate reductase family protein [Micromonospora siamensis]SCG59093.1 Dihydrofolate reductase [Micromonospora siamensis]